MTKHVLTRFNQLFVSVKPCSEMSHYVNIKSCWHRSIRHIYYIMYCFCSNWKITELVNVSDVYWWLINMESQSVNNTIKVKQNKPWPRAYICGIQHIIICSWLWSTSMPHQKWGDVIRNNFEVPSTSKVWDAPSNMDAFLCSNCNVYYQLPMDSWDLFTRVLKGGLTSTAPITK